ncbi:MAG: 30S ribosomal protein S4 [Candidatus Nanohaloarchaea archaeon]
MMKRQGKNYETPEEGYDEERIDEESRIRREYGLQNKKEVWKAQSTVRSLRRQARKLNAREDEEEKEEILDKLSSFDILDEDATLNDVLDLDIEDILERRLQTVVYRRGLANTLNEARQIVSHGHIMIDDRKVDVPGYLVTADEENEIKVAPGSKNVVKEG